MKIEKGLILILIAGIWVFAGSNLSFAEAANTLRPPLLLNEAMKIQLIRQEIAGDFEEKFSSLKDSKKYPGIYNILRKAILGDSNTGEIGLFDRAEALYRTGKIKDLRKAILLVLRKGYAEPPGLLENFFNEEFLERYKKYLLSMELGKEKGALAKEIFRLISEKLKKIASEEDEDRSIDMKPPFDTETEKDNIKFLDLKPFVIYEYFKTLSVQDIIKILNKSKGDLYNILLSTTEAPKGKLIIKGKQAAAERLLDILLANIHLPEGVGPDFQRRNFIAHALPENNTATVLVKGFLASPDRLQDMRIDFERGSQPDLLEDLPVAENNAIEALKGRLGIQAFKNAVVALGEWDREMSNRIKARFQKSEQGLFTDLTFLKEIDDYAQKWENSQIPYGIFFKWAWADSGYTIGCQATFIIPVSTIKKLEGYNREICFNDFTDAVPDFHHELEFHERVSVQDGVLLMGESGKDEFVKKLRKKAENADELLKRVIFYDDEVMHDIHTAFLYYTETPLGQAALKKAMGYIDVKPPMSSRRTAQSL